MTKARNGIYYPNIPTTIKKIYRFFFPFWTYYLKKELEGCDSVLDLGCGDGINSPLRGVSLKRSIGVDSFKPYLEECKRHRIHSEYIRSDVRTIEFRDDSFDAVLMLSILEHLKKEDGMQLINKCSLWARRKIIILTPNGYLRQDEFDSNPFQKHRCGWSVEELHNLGFYVVGAHGWKKLRGYRAELKYRPVLLWDIISDITQKFTYYYPWNAFRLFAVKTLNK